MPSNEDVALFLRTKLEEAERTLTAKQAEVEPLADNVRRLRASLHAVTAGAMGSGHTSDEQIVEWIRANATEKSPARAPEVAEGMEIDTRGISRRLPRMAKENLIAGDPERGYWIGTRVAAKTSPAAGSTSSAQHREQREPARARR